MAVVRRDGHSLGSSYNGVKNTETHYTNATPRTLLLSSAAFRHPNHGYTFARVRKGVTVRVGRSVTTN